MQHQSALFNRPDTLFGVCEGIGQEFGFHANYLRIALAVAMLWNPVVVIGTYVALGLAVLASRISFPRHRRPDNASQDVTGDARAGSSEEMALAA
ncbi:MAG: PspC domain-containing protein [Sphingomonas sp.]